MSRYLLVLFSLLALCLTACDGECGGPFVDRDPGSSKKAHDFSLRVTYSKIYLETGAYVLSDQERIDNATVTWVDAAHPENTGIITGINGDYGVFEGGDIEKANKIHITITAPGYIEMSLDVEFKKNSCDLYYGHTEHVYLEKDEPAAIDDTLDEEA
ncbi:MAG: hypothetical protein LBM75_01725 [Myxococcales bacterium]|nr:hypothetical protein [Myxococcales bacterium]